jgi:SAM-dependent methyltransferase
MPTHGEIFDFIYRNDVWKGGSGTGSREDVTRDYREFLQQFIQAARITSVVDLGCGDWQFSRHVDWSGIDYTGVDASAVVLENTGKFARPGVRFLHADGMTDALPAADLLIVKDVLQHWSNADIQAFLPQLQNYKGALITNGFPPGGEGFVNSEIRTGANYRPVDLPRPPFNLPGRYVFDFQADEPKRVFLWRRPNR